MSDKKDAKPVVDAFTKYNKAMETIKFRDKLTKVVQYGARAAKHYLLLADAKSDWGNRFDGLYSTTATGRKLFRVGKTLNELDTLRGLLLKGDEGDVVKYYLSITKQLAFGTYWLFDNIGFGIRAKFLKFDKKQMGLYGSYGWFIGSLAGLLLAAYEYQKATAKLAKKVKAYKEAKAAGAADALADAKKEVLAAGAKQRKAVEDVCRFWLDCVVSGTSAELPQRIGLTAPHDGTIGVLGALSAAIAAFQIWRDG